MQENRTQPAPWKKTNNFHVGKDIIKAGQVKSKENMPVCHIDAFYLLLILVQCLQVSFSNFPRK